MQIQGTYKYVHTYIHTHTSIHYTSIHTYIHTDIHIHIYTHTYIHTYTHRYIHTYIHIYTYIHTCLDVKGAFDAAWWPSILNTLKEFNCPKNLYNLAKSYFSGRTAILSSNTIQIEKQVSKVCPQGSCCGPGFWNIQYN